VIKGKKIQGVGLGNIFGDGPIKLRSTAGKKPGDKPLEPPKVKKMIKIIISIFFVYYTVL
jgi:hypothetical protein